MNKIAIFTSGGDSSGMNAALRSAVRTALNLGVEIYAVYEGYRGLVDGKEKIKKLTWDDVGGILQLGGTVIGTARCQRFRTRAGRLRAAHNLIENGIDALIVIGGDGSLTGADIFREDWPGLVQELVETDEIDSKTAQRYPNLHIVGLPGSIDNDMYGSDMTIGADTALHRIVEAIDAIGSTAASHQRSFVVEVMGRNCGYLAIMSALATDADWVFVPENPPAPEEWKNEMCQSLRAGREAGRRDSTVVIAEGACDSDGNPITSQEVKEAIESQLGEEARITILGHVQRGGSPSAFDRNLGTLLGHAAVEHLTETKPEDVPQLIGIRGNRVIASPLMDCVDRTQEIAKLAQAHQYDKMREMRGWSFTSVYEILHVLLQAEPDPPPKIERKLRLAVMHSGGPAPGMNTAVRAAVRWGKNQGHTMLGVHNGYPGLVDNDLNELSWMDVSGWSNWGGANLGTNRFVPQKGDFYAIARTLEEQKIEGLLVIGGEAGYDGAYEMFDRRREFPSFNIPIVCLPATIDNDRPGSELSIGADTALNSIVSVVDKIKESAVASRRCFVVETMGEHCGYLAFMSGLATGAERVYLHEDSPTLKDLQNDLDQLVTGFIGGKRLGLVIRNEDAHPIYTSDFMARLFEAEGGDLFDVRQSILGHLQQGGSPSPFDRIQATRLAVHCMDYIIEQALSPDPGSAFFGFRGGKIDFTGLEDYVRLADQTLGRPKTQWWLDLRDIAKVMAEPASHP
ncbi:MAG: ATP-dependent 6-phosphofructokinase [Chloroflexi bacterium]|nr:ATP-dependent 6-phosphofructokinase [Chloroflexota bacterium]